MYVGDETDHFRTHLLQRKAYVAPREGVVIIDTYDGGDNNCPDVYVKYAREKPANLSFGPGALAADVERMETAACVRIDATDAIVKSDRYCTAVVTHGAAGVGI